MWEYMYKYTVDDGGRVVTKEDTDHITLDEAKELWDKYLPDFIENIKKGKRPDMAIWVNTDAGDNHINLLTPIDDSSDIVGNKVYQLQEINIEKERITMPKYKAIKDLPFAKAGEEVNVRDDGTVTSPDNDNKDYGHISAYEGWIEEMSEQYKRWRADSGERYYFIDKDGDVSPDGEYGVDEDNHRYATGNYFKTEEEAEAKRDYDKAWQILVDSAKGFKPNWESGEDKWYVRYDHDWRVYSGYLSFVLGTAGVIYFATQEDAEESLKNHRKEWDLVMGVGGE